MYAGRFGYSAVPSGRSADEEADRFYERLSVCGSAAGVIGFAQSWVKESLVQALMGRGEVSAHPVRRAKQIIKERFSEPVTLKEIASDEGFSYTYLAGLFKSETGQTFGDYIREVRMNEAKRLLRESNMSVGDICKAVGYTDQKHFNASFKKTTGVKPTEFRKLYSWEV
jgi:two-component system response regulator YesN